MTRNEMSDQIEAFMDQMIDEEKEQSTIVHYRHVIQLMIAGLPDGEVKKKDTLKLKKDMMKKYKPATVNNYIVIMNKFVSFAGDEGLTVERMNVQKTKSLDEVMEPSDFKRMIRHAKQMEMWQMYYLMKVIAYTGIRIEERKALTVENLKLDFIPVHNKGKTRNIIIRSDLRRELKKYCKDEGIKEGYIFTGEDRKTLLSTSTIWYQMKKIAAHAHVKKTLIHPHSFRHLFALKFLADGNDITELADILGHNSLETTRIYTRTTDVAKRKKMEAMKY